MQTYKKNPNNSKVLIKKNPLLYSVVEVPVRSFRYLIVEQPAEKKAVKQILLLGISVLKIVQQLSALYVKSLK